MSITFLLFLAAAIVAGVDAVLHRSLMSAAWALVFGGAASIYYTG